MSLLSSNPCFLNTSNQSNATVGVWLGRGARRSLKTAAPLSPLLIFLSDPPPPIPSGHDDDDDDDDRHPDANADDQPECLRSQKMH